MPVPVPGLKPCLELHKHRDLNQSIQNLESFQLLSLSGFTASSISVASGQSSGYTYEVGPLQL